MRGRGVALAIVLLGGLLLGVQLLATDTGVVYGEHWSDPAEIAEGHVSSDGGVADLAAAGGDPGAVAWLQRTETEWRVRLARVRSDSLRVQEPETVATSVGDLDDVAVAADGSMLAVAWKNVSTSAVHLAVRDGGEWRRHVFPGGLVVDEPSVSVRDGVPVLAWQARWNGSRAVELAAVTDGGTVRDRFGRGVTGEGSPAVVAAADRLALAMINGTISRAEARFLRLENGAFAIEAPRVLGRARPRSVTRGAGGTAYLDAAGTGSAVHVLWTDIRTIHVRPLTPVDGPGTATEIARGRVPGIAADGDERVVGWLRSGRTTSFDVAAAYRGPGGNVTETVARLSSTATFVEPVFAPAPAVAWTERGGDRSRILLARYGGPFERTVLDRLAQSPNEFVAMAVAALAVGFVTLPMMPWTVAAMVIAFIVTTGVVVRRVEQVLGLFGVVVDRGGSPGQLRRQFSALPAWAWIVPYGAVQTGIALAVVLTTPRALQIGFTAPVLTGMGAVLATLGFVRLAPIESNWQAVVATAYAHNAAMWVTALPTFL